jgi:hypothetical protein
MGVGRPTLVKQGGNERHFLSSGTSAATAAPWATAAPRAAAAPRFAVTSADCYSMNLCHCGNVHGCSWCSTVCRILLSNVILVLMISVILEIVA